MLIQIRITYTKKVIIMMQIFRFAIAKYAIAIKKRDRDSLFLL